MESDRAKALGFAKHSGPISHQEQDVENVVVYVIGGGVGLVFVAAATWLIIVYKSPSEFCPDGKRHKWGMWETRNGGDTNTHRCELCGWTETVHC